VTHATQVKIDAPLNRQICVASQAGIAVCPPFPATAVRWPSSRRPSRPKASTSARCSWTWGGDASGYGARQGSTIAIGSRRYVRTEGAAARGARLTLVSGVSDSRSRRQADGRSRRKAAIADHGGRRRRGWGRRNFCSANRAIEMRKARSFGDTRSEQFRCRDRSFVGRAPLLSSEHESYPGVDCSADDRGDYFDGFGRLPLDFA